MTTISQTIPSLGSPPLTTDPANFDTRADTLYGTSLPAVITATNTWSGQANTVAGEVNTNATNAATSAAASATARTAAEAAQAAAQSASNATQWVSGQAYVAGNVVWSPSNYLSYRAVGATSGTTDPSQSASWVLLAVDVRRFTNPLAQAVSVQMTASTTVGGIQQLDNDNLDMGTNDFTIMWEGSLPDWTPADNVRFVFKVQNVDNRASFGISASSTGTLNVFIRKTGATIINAVSTVATGIADGASAKVSAVVVRETASTAGSVTFYVNGVQLGAAVAITAAATVDISNTGSMFQLSAGGTAGTDRAAGSLQASRLFNRALTAAEVLDLSINGVALADRGASQTPVLTSDFSAGVSSFTGNNGTVTGNIDTIGGEDDWLRFVVDATLDSHFARRSSTLITANTRFRISYKYYLPSGQSNVDGVGLLINNGATLVGAINTITNTTTTVTADVLIGNATSDLRFYAYDGASTVFQDAGGDDLFYIKSLTVTKLGLTSELIASNAQSDTGQILDSSGNKNHALLPASGATVVGRPVSQTREVRWTNTWAGTNELQYIGGVNQAILPANAYIESIVGTVSGATPHDIIIGDGSDTDRYVTITTGLAAGTTTFTLASRTTDGTNLKLTVDPDTNSDMSIVWLIRYSVLGG